MQSVSYLENANVAETCSQVTVLLTNLENLANNV